MAQKVYQEFQKAADRHLKTCLELKKVIENETKSDLKRKLLEDLYYLSGYIIECSCCWFVFSYEKFKKYEKREDLVATKPNECEDNVSYEQNIYPNDTLIIKDGKHYLKNFKRLYLYFREYPDVSIINGKTNAFLDATLFTHWYANIRYKIPDGVNCNEDSVFSFLAIAKSIYEGVQNHTNIPKQKAK